jgi:hypothetical protein
MAKKKTIFNLVASLTENQRKEISFSLSATAKRGRGTNYTKQLFELLGRRKVTDHAHLASILPKKLSHLNLRQLLPILERRILDYLELTSLHPVIRFRRLQIQIDLLVEQGAIDGLEDKLAEAKALAFELGRIADAAELDFLLSSERVRKEIPSQDQEARLPNTSLALIPETLARAYEMYFRSRQVYQSGDRQEAEKWAEPSAALLERCQYPLETALALKARFNLLFVQRNLRESCATLKLLLRMLDPHPPAGLEALALQRPMLLKNLAILALNSGNQVDFHFAREQLAKGLKIKGPLHQDYLIAYCAVELDFAATSGTHSSAERKVIQKLEALKEQGHVSSTALPIQLLRPLALGAFLAKDYNSCTQYAARYMQQGRPDLQKLLHFYLLRVISHFELGNKPTVGLLSREAVAALKGKKEFADFLLLFQLFSAVRNHDSLQIAIKAVLAQSHQILAPFKSSGFADVFIVTWLGEWLDDLKARQSE